MNNNNRFDFTDENTEIYNGNTSNNTFYSEYETPSPTPPKKVSERPIEIPLPKKIKLSDIILIAAFAVIFLIGIFFRLDESLPSVFGLTAFILVTAAVISAPFIDRYMLKKVCTVPTTGSLIEYESRERYGRFGSYTVYAPKYKIFINGHYEIRTFDDFSQTSNFAMSMELLANPNGYEIMPADGKISNSGKTSIIAMILIIILVLFIMFPTFLKLL